MTDAMRAQADDPLLAATDLAELLVGGARRSARRTRSSAPWCARRSTATARSPSWSRRSRASAPRASALLAPGASVAQRTTPGAGGPEPLGAQLAAMRALLDRQAQWLA